MNKWRLVGAWRDASGSDQIEARDVYTAVMVVELSLRNRLECVELFHDYFVLRVIEFDYEVKGPTTNTPITGQQYALHRPVHFWAFFYS